MVAHKLLIVDDSKGCSDMYKMRFEYADWEVKIAASAEKAIEMLNKEYLPDAILLDIMLPKMQGDELLGIIKNNPKTKDIKVVVLTALNFVSGQEQTITDKADDYILKIDIMPDELVKRVTGLLGQTRC